jgi:hypothetical protein
MERRTFLGSLAAGGTVLLAGCAGAPRAQDAAAPAVLGVIEYGQSNSEAQAGREAALLRTDYPANLRMPATSAGNVWLGLATVGGRSLELPAGAVTGLTALRGGMGSATHGSTAGESMVLRLAQDRPAGVPGEIVLFNAAEGGQAIRKLARDAPPGFYGFANLVRTVQAVDAALRAEGKRYVVRVIPMAQGETDQKDRQLGVLQERVRAEIEAAVRGITGQREPVWLLTVQPSSFQDAPGGVLGILDEHAASLARGGAFFCLGPTYNFPFGPDYLHSTTAGHDMRGELYAVAYETLLRDGRWDVLRALDARVDGAGRIVVTLTEAAEVEHVDPDLAPEHLGIALDGARIAAVRVEGTRILIDTAGPAAGVRRVRIALAGQGGKRTAQGVPRTSIRSQAAYGRYRNGAAIRKWLCHQELAVAGAAA